MFVLETQLSPGITIRTIKEGDHYCSYCSHYWHIEQLLDDYPDELAAREGHLKWVKRDWIKPQRQRLLRLLVAEDNPDDIKIAQDIFQGPPRTWEVAWVEDGYQALDFLFKRGKYSDAWTPDLIILNLNLPKEWGHGVLAKIKQDPTLRRIPVVIWTASHREEDIERAYRSGASVYLAKAHLIKEAIEDLMALRNFFERVQFPVHEYSDEAA